MPLRQGRFLIIKHTREEETGWYSNKYRFYARCFYGTKITACLHTRVHVIRMIPDILATFSFSS